MSTKAAIKLIYISGMGFIGESIGRAFAGLTGKSEAVKLLMRISGAATGAYAGVLIANDLEIMIENAMDEIKHKDDDHLEVNHG